MRYVVPAWCVYILWRQKSEPSFSNIVSVTEEDDLPSAIIAQVQASVSTTQPQHVQRVAQWLVPRRLRNIRLAFSSGALKAAQKTCF